jgi:hypothetical protein
MAPLTQAAFPSGVCVVGFDDRCLDYADAGSLKATMEYDRHRSHRFQSGDTRDIVCLVDATKPSARLGTAGRPSEHR